jgi:hypothetical protein
MKPWNSMDLDRRCWSLRDKELCPRRRRQGPTCIREQVNNWPRSIGEWDETEPSQNGPGPVGLGRPGQPDPSPVHAPLLPYVLFYLLPLPPPAATSIHSSESRRDEGEAPGGSRRPPRVLELPRGWLRPCPSHHGWPYVVKPWWSSGAATWIRQVVYTFNIRWCKYILSYFDLVRVILIHMCSYHMPLVGVDAKSALHAKHTASRKELA